jgi:3D (Asp-Asp-Asp) domain-containing protein
LISLMVASSAIQVVRDGMRHVADWVASVARSVRRVAPLVFALGCDARASNTQAAVAVKTVEVGPIVQAPANDQEPKKLGTFDFTFYYVTHEGDFAKRLERKRKKKLEAANDNGDVVLASVAPEKVTIYEGKTCEPLADVTKAFAGQLALQGTGKLNDGRTLNVWGACSCGYSPCFKVTETKWGTAGSGRGLQPFRTVAVDRNLIKLGSLLYVPQLEGKTMPGRAPWGGFVHDGCVVADDTGGGIKGNQLDLFVGRRAYVDALSGRGGSHKWARNIPIYDGSKICMRKGRKVGRKTASI